MDRDRYEQEMHRAKTLRIAATEHRDVEYWNGYIKGLTRAYLGENLLTEEELELRQLQQPHASLSTLPLKNECIHVFSGHSSFFYYSAYTGA